MSLVVGKVVFFLHKSLIKIRAKLRRTIVLITRSELSVDFYKPSAKVSELEATSTIIIIKKKKKCKIHI